MPSSRNYRNLALGALPLAAPALAQRSKSRRWFPERIGAVVARGAAEMDLQQLSKLLPIPGIGIIRIPEELQRVSFVAAALRPARASPRRRGNWSPSSVRRMSPRRSRRPDSTPSTGADSDDGRRRRGGIVNLLIRPG